MDTIVFIKRVPDTSEGDVIKITDSGKSIDKTGLNFKINTWDEYVLETAAQLKEKRGGTFTAITVGTKDWDDVLRRALAMGADKAIRIDMDVTDLEPYAVAIILREVIKPLQFDLLLFGAQSEDFGSGQLGVTVAEMLDIPHASLVTSLEIEEKFVSVNRELEAGVMESYHIKLPALLTIQTGINQPRYISLAGIKRAMKMDIQLIQMSELSISPEEIAPKIKLEKLEVPVETKQAELITGLPAESSEKLAKILQNSGVF